jgi:preprotein translocase SecE subunit
MAENNSKTKVRRIKASDAGKAGGTKPSTNSRAKRSGAPRTGAGAKSAKMVKTKEKPEFNTPTWLTTAGQPFFAIGRYVRGSWQELRMTKWPNRRATWSLTIAVLVFAIFFAVLILLFDSGFGWIMQEIIL